MRLLKLDDAGALSLIEFSDNEIPLYTILSHTWVKDEEVTFKNLMDRDYKSRAGYLKILFCGNQSARDGYKYFWVDTCCIDKSNNTEVSEALNSMFRWYHNAAKCYVYVSDVSGPVFSANDNRLSWESSFRKSRWFTRGWTLQELIAPSVVEFYSREGLYLGDKKSLEHCIHEITGIPVKALQGTKLSEFSIIGRLSWAEKRETTCQEDKAYSLLGIFNVFMPPIYGEGEDNAFIRLRAAIDTASSHARAATGNLQITDRRLHIPYLTFYNWFSIVDNPPIESHGGTYSLGDSRPGPYAQTWLNLLHVFRFEKILLNSEHIKRLAMNPGDMPPGVSDAFAIDLSCAAILAGLAGCDTLTIKTGVPVFTSETDTLEFISAGSLNSFKFGAYRLIGRFTQKPELPTYLLFNNRCVYIGTKLAAGILFYGQNTECVPTLHDHSRLMKNTQLFNDLRTNRCQCEYVVDISHEERQGLKLPLLALLAADTPETARVFPSQKAKVQETIRLLSQKCRYWKTEGNLTTENFTRVLNSGNKIRTITEAEFASMPFCGERMDRRVVNLQEVYGNAWVLQMGYSWLAAPNLYDEGGFPPVRSRPKWPMNVQSDSLVIVEGVIEACCKYIGSDASSWAASQRTVFLHTCVTAQLQEVNWWLGIQKPVAACETSILFKTLTDLNAVLLENDERRLVRAALVLRAVLVAMLLGMALDNSPFYMTDLGAQIALLI